MYMGLLPYQLYTWDSLLGINSRIKVVGTLFNTGDLELHKISCMGLLPHQIYMHGSLLRINSNIKVVSTLFLTLEEIMNYIKLHIWDF